MEVQEGSYQAFSLHLRQFPVPGVGRIRGGLRNGVYTIVGPASVRQEAGRLKLETGSLKGSFVWAKQPKGGGSFDITTKINAKVQPDGSLTGTWSVKGTQEERGKKETIQTSGDLGGWVKSQAQLQRENSLHPEASWTSYMGTHHNMQAFDSEQELVEDLRQARLVWRSEDASPTGQGNGVPFGRLGKVPRAFDHWSIGGGAGPVLIDGNIYLFYTQPVHEGPFRDQHVRILADLYGKKLAKAEGRDKPEFTLNPDDIMGDLGGLELEADTPETRERETQELIRKLPWPIKEKYSIYADEVLVCINASTGHTRWKATFPHAGVNWQDHKTGPVNLTPVVDETSVYFTGSTGRVYALDRESGELRWTAIMPTAGDVGTKSPYVGNSHAYDDNFCQSPVLVGEVLLVPDHRFTLYAFDTQTGEELWRREQGVGRVVTPMPYREDGEDYVVTMLKLKDPDNLRETIGSRFQLVRVKDGNIMWTQEGKFSRAMMLQGDTLVILGESVDAIRKIKIDYADMYGFRISAAGAEPLWKSTFRDAPFLSMNSVPVIQGNRIYTADSRGFRVLDLQTGDTLHKVLPKGGSKMSVSVLANGKLINRVDSAHGGNSFVWMNGVEGEPTLADGWSDKDGAPTYVWSPPHETTNSYSSKPMMYILADGRLFLRGAVGLFCYDLRKHPQREP